METSTTPTPTQWEGQWRPAGGDEWYPVPLNRQDAHSIQFEIGGVPVHDRYETRARYLTTDGAVSEWSEPYIIRLDPDFQFC